MQSKAQTKRLYIRLLHNLPEENLIVKPHLQDRSSWNENAKSHQLDLDAFTEANRGSAAKYLGDPIEIAISHSDWRLNRPAVKGGL